MSEYVYVLQCPNSKLIKIGRTSCRNPHHRISGIQTSNPFPLEILRIVETPKGTEQKLHKQFAKFRFNREWFKEACLTDLLKAIANFPVFVEEKETKNQGVSKQKTKGLADGETLGLGVIGTVCRYGLYLPGDASEAQVLDFFASIFRNALSHKKDCQIDFMALYKHDPFYLQVLHHVYAGYKLHEVVQFCKDNDRDLKEFPVYVNWETVFANPMLSVFFPAFLCDYEQLTLINPPANYKETVSRLEKTPSKNGGFHIKLHPVN